MTKKTIRNCGHDVNQLSFFSMQTLSQDPCWPKVLLVLLMISSCTTEAEEVVAKVKRVVDGDTIVATHQGNDVRIRLCGIDAPESKQIGGATATSILRAAIPPQTTITIRVVNVDRYNRVVANILEGGKLVNFTLVENGAAWIYERYASRCFDRDTLTALALAQSNAQTQKRGLWGESENPTPPWIYRKLHR